MQNKGEEIESPSFEIDDKYLFIGLTTGAIKNENGAFVKHSKKLFDHNKKQINKGLKKDCKLSDDLYQSLVFNVFGDYDFAFFGLADTYQFGAKNFRPYSISIEDYEKESSSFELPFHYQCFYGPHPYQMDDERLTYDRLSSLASKNCFSLCQIKLNNALLIGGGKDFLFATITKIKTVLKAYPEIQCNLSLSFSWHEITLSCFADDYITLYDAINQIRQCVLDFSAIPSWYPDTLHHQFKDSQSTDPISFIKVTNTKFGYRYDEDVEEQQKIIDAINKENKKKCKAHPVLKKMKFVSRIHAKPERVKDLYSLLNNSYEDFEVKFKPRQVSGRSVLNLSAKKLCNLFIHSEIVNHKYLRKISTFLEFYVQSEGDQYEKHTGLQEKVFDALEFDLYRIEKVKLICNRLRFPKITTERVIRLMINFNRNVNDPAIFSYFLELEGPIEYLIQLIENSKEGYNLYREVNILIDEIEKAYKTRFYHTPQFIYAGDTSTEYSGGILQIITGYDFAVKVLANLLYSNDEVFESYTGNGHFVNLTPSTGVNSKEKSVRLNFYHLFQPALVATSLMHECFNFFTDYLSEDYKNILDLFPFKYAEDIEWDKDSLVYFLNEYCDLYLYFDEDFTDGDQNTSESKAFYYAFSPNKLRTLIIDFVVWMYAYREDTALFLYWHFGAILQKTSFYNSESKPHVDDAIQLATRFYLLSHLIGALKAEGVELQPFDNGYLERSLQSIFKDVAYPYNNKSITEALQDLNHVSEIFIKRVFDMEGQYLWHLNEMISRSPELEKDIKLFGIDKTLLTFRYVRSIAEGIDDISDYVKEDLENNRVMDFMRDLKSFILTLSKCDDCISKVEYAPEIVQILFDHLKNVKTLTTKGKDQDKFNYEQFVLHNSKENIEGGAGVMFNPQGGGFSTEYEVRANLLTLNSKFYFDLWHLAQSQKKTTLNNLYSSKYQ